MIVSNTGKFVLHLNEVEDTRLDGYTIRYIRAGPENSWMNVIPTARPNTSAEETELEYEPSEDEEEEVGAPSIGNLAHITFHRKH